MVNHEDGWICSYSVPNKEIQGGAEWIPRRLAKDIDGCGCKDAKVQVKSDQEPSIVVVQHEIQKNSHRQDNLCE